MTYPTNTRASPLDLLKQYVTTTGRNPRYIRVDSTKDFTSQKVVDYCRDNDIILQVVVAYNHTMQARVEGEIGCSKQHSRIALLPANKPTRFWDHATEDVTIKKKISGLLETSLAFLRHLTTASSLRSQVFWRPSVCHLAAENHRKIAP